MVKKKGHRDAEKKAVLAAKKEAKQEKAAKKRLLKLNGGVMEDDDDSSNDSNESDVDDSDDEAFHELLRNYKQQHLNSDSQPSAGAESAAVATSSGSKTVRTTVTALPNDRPFPCARASATFTIIDDSKKKDVYLFGGEYYDGTNIIVSDQLFKYELPSTSTASHGKVAVGQWKQIITPTSPPPRCAHAAGYYNKSLYIFGGESSGGTTGSTGSTPTSKKASSSKGNGEYYHYRDIWKFDTVQQQWYEMKPSIPLATGKNSIPTPRSGMSMTIWKHYMIIFGGFYEAATQAPPRFYNDVYVLNLQTEQWLDVPYSKLSIRPEPRSACNDALLQNTVDNNNCDSWLIHGGFSKLQTNASRLLQNSQTAATNTRDAGDVDDGLPTAETIVYTDAWVLRLHPILEGKPPTWERLISSLSKNKRYETAQIVHNGRSGVSSTSYQNNLLLFGGVIDQELLHHKVDSTFYNDLSIFHTEKRKFIPIHLQDPSVKLKVPNRNNDVEHTAVGDSLQAVEINLSLEDDDQGKSENRKNMGWDIDKLRTNMFAFVDGRGNTIYEKIDSVIQKREIEEVEATKKRIVERTEPFPRIKACIFMNGHVMYVYGGILEIGDREVTLDDMWCIDLRKTRTWQCIYTGTMHEQVWRGAVYDDDDSYYSNSANCKDDNADVDEKNDVSSIVNKVELAAVVDRTLAITEVAPIVSVNPKEEMIELVERYSMNDDNQTPRPDETLSDFFVRTEPYWKELTTGSSNISISTDQRESHNESFDAAQARYNELVPVMERLTQLKLLRKQEKSKQKVNC